MTELERKIEELLNRGVEEVIDREHLKRRLFSGERLRVKCGVDPTKPDIHLGHTIPLKKLKKFQELGHTIVFIVGDFTAQIGDPSGRIGARILLTPEQISKNAKTYLKQVGKVIDIKKIEIQKNSQWYGKMKLKDFLEIAKLFTIARILERDDFTKRIKMNINVHLQEILYPLLQAYDSIMVRADVELGGTDQKFNMLMGRILQKRLNKPQQDVITLPLLIGLDGKRKMSKSFNNYIGVAESPREQYGKIMSIPDNLITYYFELCTDAPLTEVKQVSPREAKARLAREIVKMYHGESAALRAEKEFNRVFKEGKVPVRILTFKITEKFLNILDLLTKTKLAPSKSEAKRLVGQKGVKIDGKIEEDWRKIIEIKKRMIIQVGKRKFIRVG